VGGNEFSVNTRNAFAVKKLNGLFLFPYFNPLSNNFEGVQGYNEFSANAKTAFSVKKIKWLSP